MTEQPSRTTGYPAIECCCHRWPAVQLQRTSCQEGRVGPQEEMFLSSSNLFSTIKEGPASHSYSGCAYAAFLSQSRISADFSSINCPKLRSRPFTGLQTVRRPTFNTEALEKHFILILLLLCIIVSSFYSSLRSSE